MANLEFGKAASGNKMNPAQSRSLKSWDSVSNLSGNRVTLIDDYNKAKAEAFSGDEGKKVLEDLQNYIFSKDPEAINPIASITAEFKSKNQSIDNKIDSIITKINENLE